MTALPLWPPRLLTVAEFAELPESSDGRYELQEGHVVMSPRPTPRHQRCLRQLLIQLSSQAPDELEVMPEVDVDLRLASEGEPGFVRIPDLVVVTHVAYERSDREGGLLRAADAVLAVEIVSRGSQRTDHLIKHSEYADAGIAHYWIVDPGDGADDRPSLTACHRAGEFGYADAPAATGVFTTDAPFPVRLDLDRLA
jgi:Uma2 family endonuclease